MKGFINILTSFIVIVFLQSSAYAVLDLELTQGVESTLPIAIVPFQTEGSEKPTLDVADVIAHDLQNSGQFGLFDSEKMEQFPHHLSEVDGHYWRDHDIDHIVFGRIESQGNDRYRISFTLLDLYKSSSFDRDDPSRGVKKKRENPILISKSFTVKGSSLRRVAHLIADEVYEKLIGERGIFQTKIAYVMIEGAKGKSQKKQYKLMLADADGQNLHSVLVSSSPIMSPVWSPNGEDIAYVSFENRRASVYVSNVITGKRRLIAQFPGVNGAPAWSPDGKSLALVLTNSGAPNIYIVNLKTGRLKQMTRGDAIDTEPAWSPDGRSLIFTSGRSGGPQIYRLSLKKGKIERLTYQGAYNARASFTPDGENIVMLHRDSGRFAIAIQNLKTGILTLLTRDGNDQSPSISPNGKMIIYASENEDGKDVLGVVSTDGQVKLVLPETEGIVREPAWSPFLN